MSLSPWQPSNSRPPARDYGRLLAAVVLFVVLGAGLFLLGLSLTGGQRGASPVAQATATPDAQSTAVALELTPARGTGLGGPQPPIVTPLLPTATPPQATSTKQADSSTATPEATPLSPAERTLKTLSGIYPPARDPYALAARLKHRDVTPGLHTSDRPPGNYEAGHKDVFNISDIQNRNYYTVSATIRLVTDHAYWYIQDSQTYDQNTLSGLAEAFEGKIYTTDREIFGSEWNPGVDNDPRITILFSPLRGAGGSFSAADEYTREVNPFSNEREMIYISTASGWAGLEGTLAHELQHMIHWHEHANQDIWLNEGASVLATALNGYDVLGVDGDFMRKPDTQLNSWKPSPSQARPNYGAAFLFLDFLRTHYGGDAIIKAVTAAKETDTRAITSALAQLGYKETFTDVLEQWMVANLVDGEAGASDAYTYPNRTVQASPQVTMDHYPTGLSGHVPQFGANYLELTSPTDGSSSLHVDFSGQAETALIDAPAHSGSSIWWSNRGDLTDSMMTRNFDLSGLQKATLDGYVWYDIEQDFDYAYAEVSTDGGATWDTLQGKYTTSTNPNGTNYGNAYTGLSADRGEADPNGWLHESFDLSKYAGKQVLVRFEYITDDGYNAQGFAVDDISIPELGYADDAEHDTGWQTDGFARLDNKLPQSYYLAVVRMSPAGMDVQPVTVNDKGEASFDIEGLGNNGAYSKAVLVIAGTTPHNIQQPTYEVSVRPGK